MNPPTNQIFCIWTEFHSSSRAPDFPGKPFLMIDNSNDKVLNGTGFYHRSLQTLGYHLILTFVVSLHSVLRMWGSKLVFVTNLYISIWLHFFYDFILSCFDTKLQYLVHTASCLSKVKGWCKTLELVMVIRNSPVPNLTFLGGSLVPFHYSTEYCSLQWQCKGNLGSLVGALFTFRGPRIDDPVAEYCMMSLQPHYTRGTKQLQILFHLLTSDFVFPL